MHPDNCIHYNGSFVNAACNVGIVYGTLPKPEPCWQRMHGQAGTDDERLARCAQFRRPTRKEWEEDRAHRDQEIKELLAKMGERERTGCCTMCGKLLTAQRQVGRCIYAEPCGCRLGQGTLMDQGRRVQRLVVTQGESP